MRNRTARLLPLLFFFALNVFARDTLFGPKTYTMATGAPQSFTDTFPVDLTQDCDGKADYILVIQNGDTAVASATLSLNGTPLLPQSSFKLPASSTEIPVIPLSANTLNLTLSGGYPGSSVVVTVVKQIEETVTGAAVNATLTSKQQIYSANFSISDPSDSFALVVRTGDANGANETRSFSILLNGVEIANEHDLVGNSLLLRKPVILQSDNTLSIELKSSVGDVLSATLKRELDESACGPKVFIDTPAQDTSVAAPHLVVSGHAIAANADFGVTVDDHVAQIDLAHAGSAVDPFRWVVVLDPPAGPVVLSAVAIDSKGATGSFSRSLTYAPSAELVSFQPLIDHGLAPYTATFNVTPSDAAAAIQTYDLDLDGDGVFETAGLTSLPDPVTFTYTAGIFKPQVRVTFTDGTQYVATTAVTVVTPILVDTIVRRRFGQLQDALAAQDIDSALTTVVQPSQAKYRSIWTTLFAELPSIVPQMTFRGAISIHADYADYLVTRDINGVPTEYHLSMIRNAAGLWKIADF